MFFLILKMLIYFGLMTWYVYQKSIVAIRKYQKWREKPLKTDEEQLYKKQIAWQVEVVEALYNNKFKPIGYQFPYKKLIEEGVLLFYKSLGEEDAWKQYFCYHFLRKVAAHSTHLQYLSNYVYNRGIANIFSAMHYWQGQQKVIRDIADWEIKHDSHNVYEYCMQAVEFLFAKYPVPLVITKVWSVWSESYAIDFCEKYALNKTKIDKNVPQNPLMNLFFYLAEGGSLRCNPYFDWRFSKKAAHVFCTENNRHTHWITAYWEAVGKAEGVSEDRIGRIHDILYYLEPTEYPFWRVLLQQIANLSEEEWATIDIVGTIEIAMMVKFARSRYEEEEDKHFYHLEPDFRWETRKLSDSAKYLLRCYTVQYPIPQDFENSYTIVDSVGGCWHFTLLRNRHELFLEGQAMEHCVGDGDYHYDALKGDCSYWSLQKRDKNGEAQRRLTLEVQHDEQQLMTALGKENRDATTTELAVLERWCALVQLKMNAAELAEQE